VPDEPQHVAAFLGCLYNLTSARFWADDIDHTAKQVAAVWQAIYDDLERCNNAPNTGFAGAEGGDEYMLRQDPANPCKLQTSVNGTDWCDWADLSLCITGAQPGAGAPQPGAGGGSECYTGKLQANGKFLIPVTVNTGDTLTAQSLQGAGNDGGSHWYCPDGNIFFAGACVGGAEPNTPDPLNTANHMAIIVEIGGTFYDLSAGTVTVGGGVVNAQPVVQVNDDTLSDNSGEYTLSVCVTNNSAVQWCKTLDFRFNTFGFVQYNVPPDNVMGHWSAGVGFVWDDDTNGTGVSRRGVDITVTVPSFHATRAILNVNQTLGSTDNSGDATDYVSIGSTVVISKTFTDNLNGTPLSIDSGPVSATGTVIRIHLNADRSSGGTGGFTGGVTALSITFYGDGTPLTLGSNC
jgi:hypothetical protein